jgi:hypothetical protein
LALASVAALARVDPSEPVLCDPSGQTFWKGGKRSASCRPHLRIWLIPEPEQLRAEEVDPAIRERLRALGYEW